MATNIPTVETLLSIEKQVFLPTKACVSLEEVARIGFQVGEVTQVEPLKNARAPSYKMKLNFGDLGEKITCGQLVKNHTAKELLGTQLLGITNFAPKRIAGVKSEVLTVGFPDESASGQAIPLSPLQKVTNGTAVGEQPSVAFPTIEFGDFTKLEIRAGTIQKIHRYDGGSFAILTLGGGKLAAARIVGQLERASECEGKQVPVLINLKPINRNEKIYSALILTVTLNPPEYSTLIVVRKPVQDGVELF